MNTTISAFEKQFNHKPFLFTAPGRINLIGEHTDYNGGFVMPAAIDKQFEFAIAPNATNQFNLVAIDLDQTISFTSNQLQAGHQWHNYLMGVVDGFLRRGKNIESVNCVFSSTIPAGAGLSSSAALCSGFGFALNEIFECNLTKLDLALIAQEAEHNFAGTKCGIMDMYASIFSKENSVMLLDCRTNQHEYLLADFAAYDLLLIDTKVKHTLNDGGYNDRRASCEEGVKIMQQKFPSIKLLRDVSKEMLESSKSLLSEKIYRRCFYVVDEIERTQKAASFLKAKDLENFGKLMYDTHWGLSKQYEVSCAESDWLVTYASENKITGARQMGGGFGGCTLNLIKKELVNDLKEDVRKNYFETFNIEPKFYPVKISEGVHQVN